MQANGQFDNAELRMTDSNSPERFSRQALLPEFSSVAPVEREEASPSSRVPRILLVSLLHPELVRGGAQQVCYELFQGLQEEADVETFLLASTDTSYPALFKLGARITGFDGRRNEFLFLSADYDYLWHRTTSSWRLEGFQDFLET